VKYGSTFVVSGSVEVAEAERVKAGLNASIETEAGTAWTSSRGWRAAPTTTWSNRSTCRCWWPGSARYCAGPPSPNPQP
jgi:hypothetical protein